MKQAVADAFVSFTTGFEGATTWLYLDVRGLVTTGIGNLVDSPDQVTGLEWVHLRSGAPATQGQVIDAWRTVKAAQSLRQAGGGAFAALTDLRLTPGSVTKLVNRRLNANEAILHARWVNYDSWPADAQLGAHSCAWAAGAAWPAPKFDAAVLALDFDTCAGTPGVVGSGEAWLNDTGNPGLRPRNFANQKLFANAAAVVSMGTIYSLDVLYYPGSPTL